MVLVNPAPVCLKMFLEGALTKAPRGIFLHMLPAYGSPKLARFNSCSISNRRATGSIATKWFNIWVPCNVWYAEKNKRNLSS